jgi:hypothetical protein
LTAGVDELSVRGGHKIMHGSGSLWSIQRSDRARFRARDLSTAGLPNLVNPAIADSSSQPAGTDKPGAEMEGFRHFMKVPTEGQRFTIDGTVFDPEKMWDRADELMQKLVRRIGLEPRPDDPGIPSGYTYFLQLVAHDIVHSTLVVSRNAGRTLGTFQCATVAIAAGDDLWWRSDRMPFGLRQKSRQLSARNFASAASRGALVHVRK